MSHKKPYEPPKIYRVELNQEQAIIGGCQTGVTSISAGGGAVGCSASCRRSTGTDGLSGPTLS